MMRACLLLLVLLCPVAAIGAETIESFHADIDVHENGDLTVTETILVRAEGRQIRRGIYRDFPTRYRGPRGGEVNVGFRVLEVQRDGISEPYRVQNHGNGKRVYIGDANVFLAPGMYEYRLRYLTTRQLGFFDHFDELYWNVTGNGWAFPISSASARVSLPAAVIDLRLSGYTGRQGSTAQELDFRRDGGAAALFETRGELAPGEGLTIVANWPKGIVDEPTAAQRRAWFVADHKPALIAGAGALALLTYYLLLWHWVGRDPEAGVTVPRYRAPRGYSPASMRFIERMGYDNKCFTSAVVNLAVKGALEIEDTSGFRILRGDTPQAELAAGEKQVLDGLLEPGRDEIGIVRSNHSILSKAIKRHKRSLALDYEKVYFKTNRWLLLPGILVSLLLIAAAVASLPSEEAILKTVFLGIFGLFPLIAVYSSLRALLRRGRKGFVRWGIFLVPLVVFLGMFYSAFPFAEFADGASISLLAGVIAMLVMHALFYRLLQAPTLAGRRLLDEIEGFKHYLEVAEEDEIALRDAPQFTTDLYEAYLPYAIALDLENEWTAKLDRAISAGLVERGYTQPRWYRSHGRSTTHFSSTLSNSLNSAIASSSIAPGSSSGSSGGSSGGGGGGGGGGGW